jgi:penicillin-binding protein 1A
MKKTWKIILISISIIILSAIILFASLFSAALRHLQNKDELQSYKNATATVVLSEEGDIIGKIFSENRTDVSYSLIPSHLINALIATEDTRFFEHKGIDSRSLIRVLFKTIILGKQSSGGGSTITQQLAKNMFGRSKSGYFVTLKNKTRETILAHRLEKIYTKEEILTLYLNTVPFGENVFGIEAAAARFFNKKTELLNIQESAVLIGMLKANDFYNPRLNPENAINRRNVVLNQMKKYNYLESSECDSLCRLPMVPDYINIEYSGPADYFLYQVKNEAIQILKYTESKTGKKWNIETDGLIINTTLNLTLQNYANIAFHDHMPVMQKKLNKQYGIDSDSLIDTTKFLHAGMIAINPVTGAVKAWVGGIDFKSQPYDQILARRQLASTFKPILYAAAFEKGFKPCDYLDNDSIVLPDYIDWSPENFDRTYGGKYSLAGALVNSMNVPTFNLFMNIGFGTIDSLWRKMGFSFPLENAPSLAMGTAEATVLETSIAYSAFANGGYKINPQKIVSITSSDGEVLWQNEFSKSQSRVISGRTSRLMSEILQKAVREGTGAAMGSVYGVTLPIAGKTGTSQDYADAWFAAFNPTLVIVSRVGAMLPSVHFYDSRNGTGSALALPLVALTLKKVQKDNELMIRLISPFPVLSPELAAELDCPDFKEDRLFENVFDFFRRDKNRSVKDTTGSGVRKKSIFKRIFGERKQKKDPRK